MLNVQVLIKAKRLPAGVSEDDEIEDEDDDHDDEKNKKMKKKISKKLSDLVNYIHAVHFNGFDDKGKSKTNILENRKLSCSARS